MANEGNKKKATFTSANMSNTKGEKEAENKIEQKKIEVDCSNNSKGYEHKINNARVLVGLVMIICVIMLIMSGVSKKNNGNLTEEKSVSESTKSTTSKTEKSQKDDIVSSTANQGLADNIKLNGKQKEVYNVTKNYLTEFLKEEEFKKSVNKEKNELVAPCVKKVILEIIENESASYAERAKPKMSGVNEYLTKEEYDSSIDSFELLHERAAYLRMIHGLDKSSTPKEELISKIEEIDKKLRELANKIA